MYTNGGSALGLEDLAIYVSLVGSQIFFAVVTVLTGNELAKGTNPLTFVAYTSGFGGLLLSPFAFFFEKKSWSKVSFSLLGQLLLLSLGGVCAFQVLLLMGLKETSPSLASAMPNLAPAIIFVMAWTLGMEKVDMKCAYSQFKIVGTVICVCGAMAMSFLHGPALSQLWPSPQAQAHTQNIILNFLHEGNSSKTITGCIYLLTAVIILSSSMILQGETLKKYPAPLSLTAITSLLGSIQTAVLIMALDKGVYASSWFLDWSGVVTVMFGGMFCNAIAFSLQSWCIQKRGPAFVATFGPVCTVCSAILSSSFLGETLHLGSVVGGLLIFGGLYLVLWGKSKEIDDERRVSDEEEQLDRPHKVSKDVKTPLLC
ncbi:WAT1-related protein At5g47470 [Cryptomeria japonica]|uniref:WAT1-related protein At5g47470 n=1 Tax=Cryptomeria japonica TaxID=3369 RepID=UPI0025ACC5A6|nr:WAT1-related protein At5g47470 [Cryptomeria japonica]